MADKQSTYKNGVLITLSVMGNKWKPLILCHLIDGSKRTSEIKAAVPGISSKVLTDQLRQLEEDGIINRKIFNEVPPHVEYSISDYGKTLIPVLNYMAEWGEKRIEFLKDNGKDIKLDFTDHEKYNI